MNDVAAPSGWGFIPGTPLFIPAASRLPDLPLLPHIHPMQRAGVVRDALLQVPGIVRDLRPRDLIEKYQLPQTTASHVLADVRTKT